MGFLGGGEELWELSEASGGNEGRESDPLALAALALLIYTEASYMQVQTRVHGFPRKPGNPSGATDAS